MYAPFMSPLRALKLILLGTLKPQNQIYKVAQIEHFNNESINGW